jgi:MFS family permease
MAPRPTRSGTPIDTAPAAEPPASGHRGRQRWYRRGLWRQPAFVTLWAGQTVSEFGSQITALALPLTATLLLQASPMEMGVLGAAGLLPWLLLGLFAGAWVDRRRRRPIMIAADLGRAVLLGSVPAAALLGALRMEHLIIVSFLSGVLTLCFGLASSAYVLSLVRREHLVEANSKLTVSRSAAEVAGPGVAGTLVQGLTAPLAIAFDALSFVVSAGCIVAVRLPEGLPPTEGRRGTLVEVREGLHMVWTHPILRALAAASATNNFFANVLYAVYVLYVTREVGVAAAVLGAIYAAGSAGALASAASVGWITTRLGLGPTLVGATLLLAGSNLLIPLAGGTGTPPTLAVLLLGAARVLAGCSLPAYNVNFSSLRQAITPDGLQGRVNASIRFVTAGAMPLGALVGGALGQAIGLRPTLALGALGTLFAVLWLLASPVRGMRSPPAPTPESSA